MALLSGRMAICTFPIATIIEFCAFPAIEGGIREITIWVGDPGRRAPVRSGEDCAEACGGPDLLERPRRFAAAAGLSQSGPSVLRAGLWVCAYAHQVLSQRDPVGSFDSVCTQSSLPARARGGNVSVSLESSWRSFLPSGW